jgi:hypothetical protein
MGRNPKKSDIKGKTTIESVGGVTAEPCGHKNRKQKGREKLKKNYS